MREPKIAVGIMDRQLNVRGCFNGSYHSDKSNPLTGGFAVNSGPGIVILVDNNNKEIACSPEIRLTPGDNSTFTLYDVTIGNSFHWERKEHQTFLGDIVFKARHEGAIAVINSIKVEDYLTSVISSEMKSNAPLEFLRTHAIISRSWLLKSLERKRQKQDKNKTCEYHGGRKDEIVRWYEQEEHDIYDVCADDHCQRYQGITKIVSDHALKAVLDTSGQVISYGDEICDARYYKACGGITEDFSTAWDDKKIPYLKSISDAPARYDPVMTEDDARRWIFSEPEAYCNTKDRGLLETILPDFDLETNDFFRWKVEYEREQLEEILQKKSGIDLGTLKEVLPLKRGPSGRIIKLKIAGSKKTMVVGKELEIRRWLSKSHLYSSAFIVETIEDSKGKVDRFIFYGAGWGHGVGLCQIGAAVMADRGFTYQEILRHYFPDTMVQKIY